MERLTSEYRDCDKAGSLGMALDSDETARLPLTSENLESLSESLSKLCPQGAAAPSDACRSAAGVGT
eukprot:3894873-Rhodomonas_salina.1